LSPAVVVAVSFGRAPRACGVMPAERDSLRILGVDTGSTATGWGLLVGSSSRPRLIDCGVLRLSDKHFAQRLARLQTDFERVVEEASPTVAAVETLFHGANARSALQLAHARGVILAVLARAGVGVSEYTPATVKQSVTGSGRADKEQVRAMVMHLLGLDLSKQPADLSDALAIALCHTTRSRFAARVESSETRAASVRRVP